MSHVRSFDPRRYHHDVPTARPRLYDSRVEEDAAREWKIRLGALPIAFALALLFHSCSMGHFAQRTALTMPLHELGHAISAWLSGYAAIPTLWKTLIPETRGFVIPLLLAGLNGFSVWRGWVTDRMWLCAIGLGLGVLQFLGTTASPSGAAEVITFSGDAGAMVLGTVLVGLFFVGDEDSKLRQGGLRYGLLAIGAAALVDTFAVWWSARTDPDSIPFGEIEGVGLSDPSKLDEIHGWTTHEMVSRYVTVGVACLIACIGVWLWATWRARSDAGR